MRVVLALSTALILLTGCGDATAPITNEPAGVTDAPSPVAEEPPSDAPNRSAPSPAAGATPASEAVLTGDGGSVRSLLVRVDGTRLLATYTTTGTGHVSVWYAQPRLDGVGGDVPHACEPFGDDAADGAPSDEPSSDEDEVDAPASCVPLIQLYAEPGTGPGGGTIELPVGTWRLWARATNGAGYTFELGACQDVVARDPDAWTGFSCDDTDDGGA